MNLSTLSNLYGIGNIIARITGNATIGSIIAPGYRPSQWKHYRGGSNAILTQATNIGGLMFDAIITSTHESSLTVTKHPVQYGADISDHAIVNPARLTLSVAVSDAMGYISGPNQYPGNGMTKSTKAFDTLLQFQRLRTPMTVFTKLRKYENMVITNITAEDDYTTAHALKATVELEQMMIVSVSETKVSARQWTMDSKRNSTVQPQGLSDAQNTTMLGMIDPAGPEANQRQKLEGR